MTGTVTEERREAASEVIYGTITILAVILALNGGSYGPWAVVLSVVVSSYALALAKLYAGTVSHMLARGRQLESAEYRTIWRAARPVMIYSQFPTLVFVMCGLGLFTLDTAFWVAEVSGMLILFASGYLVGRRIGLSMPKRLLSGAVVGAAGLAVILLKLLTH